MKASIRILFLCGIIFFTAFSCEKEEEILPSSYAEGRIIQIFGGCYGECIMIEVENPEGIGVAGTFAFPGNEESRITYKNAIGVPWFSKLPDVPEDIPETIGTWLYFEYRDVKEKEKEDLFQTRTPIICPANIIPPSVKLYVITKIIEFK